MYVMGLDRISQPASVERQSLGVPKTMARFASLLVGLMDSAGRWTLD
jgi:hypothetical protein